MSIQELLTYVEELSFKTSMIGYDKDEVDIQLDKICDEIEAIVKEKDDEIAALRSGAPAAPVVVDLNENKEPAEEEKAVEKKAEPKQEEGFDEFYEGSDDSELREQIDALKDKLARTEDELTRIKDQIAWAEERAEEAEQRAAMAEKSAQEAEEELAALQGQEGRTVVPQDTDAAYRLYMKNADLLCKQLEAVDAQKEEALAQAREEADGILASAREEQARILDQTREEAEQLEADAEEHLAQAKEEAERILEEGRAKLQAEQEEYEKLAQKRESLVSFMKEINTDIQTLIDKVSK